MLSLTSPRHISTLPIPGISNSALPASCAADIAATFTRDHLHRRDSARLSPAPNGDGGPRQARRAHYATILLSDAPAVLQPRSVARRDGRPSGRPMERGLNIGHGRRPGALGAGRAVPVGPRSWRPAKPPRRPPPSPASGTLPDRASRIPAPAPRAAAAGARPRRGRHAPQTPRAHGRPSFLARDQPSDPVPRRKGVRDRLVMLGMEQHHRPPD